MFLIEDPRRDLAPPTVRSDIQGLRAVAVALVVATHVFNVPHGGFIGVDVFFVISGFLITGLLVRERDRSGRISFREFYARRARRILPMSLLVLVATDVAARLIFTGVRAHQTVVDSWWSLGFLANVHFTAIGTSYFDALRPPSAVQHYWSLAVEEQFYLVWPCLLLAGVFVARRLRIERTKTAVGATALVLTAASLAFCIHATKSDPTGSYFSTATRAWELGIGALAAVLQASVERLPMLLRKCSGWLGLGLIVLAALVIKPTTPFPGTAALLPVLATALVLIVGSVSGGVGSRWALGNPVSMYLGQISYSLYLWHWPVLIFAKTYFGGTGTAYYAVSTVGALGLSAGTNWFIEEPFRHSKWLSRTRAPRDRRRIWEWVWDNERQLVPVFAVVIVALVWASVHVAGTASSGGTTQLEALPGVADVTLNHVTASPTTTPLTPLEQTIEASLTMGAWPHLVPSLDALVKDAAPEWVHDKCLDVDQHNEAKCVYGPASAPRLAVVVGDSVAVSYMQGLRGALASQGWRVQLLTKGECPMIDAPTRHLATDTGPFKECMAHRTWAVGEIRRLHPDMVISSSAVAFVDRLVDGGRPGDPANLVLWQTATQRMAANLSPLTGKVVVLGAPPGLANLQDCATRVNTPADCVRPLAPRWLSVQDAERSAATAAGARYVDPLSWFCFAHQCPAVIDTTPVSWDGTHLTATYSRSLAPLLSQALLS